MKKLFALVFAIYFSFCCYAQDWYVCLGSFSKKQNAEIFKTLAENEQIPVFIVRTFDDNNKKIFRVILNDSSTTQDEARTKRNNFSESEFARKNNLSGLWICQANAPKKTTFSKTEPIAPQTDFIPHENQPSEQPVKTEEKSTNSNKIILEKNEKIPVSEEKPYSLLIQTYKEEQVAESDKNRLVEKNVDAYIIKKFDDTENFNFDLHAGATETQKELEKVAKQLEDLNITDFKITDYNDYSKKLVEYDELVENKKITFDFGVDSLPKNLSPNILDCLNQFPVNKNFEIESVFICDLLNLFSAKSFPRNKKLIDFLSNVESYGLKDKSSAISYATYRDSLFNKYLTILIATSKDSDFEIKIDKELNPKKIFDFSIKYGTLHTYLFEGDDIYTLEGTTSDKKLYIKMILYNFSEAELESLLNNYYSDSSLLIYPQIRKTLCVLPQDKNQEFISYSLDKVDWDYVEEKNYAPWSKKIYGHWQASHLFNQDEEMLSISFFDLDYDYNAIDTHNIFMSEKMLITESKSNHFQKVHDINGWYLENTTGNELSFSIKSYIIAIDSELNSKIKNAELLEISDQLKIWK